MSSGIILLLVTLVLLVIVIYLAGVIIRKRNDALITKLKAKKEQLFQLPIADEIEEVKNLQLIGQSQVAFREWNQKWTDLSSNSFTEFDRHIDEAQNFNDTFHFIKCKHLVDRLESQLTLIDEDCHSISEALSILREQEEKNSARVTHALDLYEKLQQSIEDKVDNFGTTMPEIEKQLKNIETEFSQFVLLNSTGDPVEASEVLDRAEEHTIALGQITEQIPPIVAKLEDDFPDQLDDLESGYRQLLEQEYYFSEKNIESRFQSIRESIRENSSELVTLDLDRAREENEHIQEKIDLLYTFFEEEINAYKQVVKDCKVIPKFLEHAKTNNSQLEKEITRLGHKYIFNANENLSLTSFTKTLSEIEEKTLPIVNDYKSVEKPFSELHNLFINEISKLKEIEEGQMDIFNEIKDIEKVEQIGRQKLNKYINDLHMIKRYMEKKNLPGIPQDFLSIFFTTSSQLEALMDELSKGKINIDAVARLTDVSTVAISNLEDTTYRIVQYATLTEQLLQYSNRYRSFESNVQTAFNHALKIFEVDHDYKTSFDEISLALETVEPGVTDRFVSSYEKTRERILF